MTTDAVTLQLDAAVNERDAAMALLMDALLLLKGHATLKHSDVDDLERWHRRVGDLVMRIDASDARRKAEGTLR
jgi:hypothetical protein